VIYLDTSCLLKLYAHEQGSEELAAWLVGRRGVVCSGHGRLELISALKRHQREDRLDDRGLRQALTRLETEEGNRLIEWLPITNTLINAACAMVAELPSAVFIRAGDALHLACAKDAGLREIYSHDRHLLAAAPHFGLKGVDVIQSV
jgi:predicted nucleic acid-binding protein